MAAGSYVRQTWANGPGGGTPTNATRLNHVEAGIKSQSDRLDQVEALGVGGTPVTMSAVSGTITPTPGAGRVFLHDITGANATLGTPAAGANGQVIDVVVYTSNAARTLTVAGTAIAISTTSPWWGRFVYIQARDEWVLNDATGSGGSGGSSYTDEQVRDVVGATLVQGANVTITPNDAGDTITISAATSGSSGIPAATVDAKGDLIAGTANDTVARVPVGTNGLALVANSANATGLAWAAPAPAAHQHAPTDITYAFASRTASRTLTAADVGVEQSYDSSSAGTFTVPTDVSATIAVGSRIPLSQVGTGQLTIAGASGVTVQARGGALKLAGQHAQAELLKIAASTWRLYGDTTT